MKIKNGLVVNDRGKSQIVYYEAFLVLLLTEGLRIEHVTGLATRVGENILDHDRIVLFIAFSRYVT
jgi:hypothetical protein